MKRLLVALAVLAAMILLVGCGPSKCVQAGGKEVFSHYVYMPITMPNGNGGTTTTITPIPQYTCEVK